MRVFHLGYDVAQSTVERAIRSGAALPDQAPNGTRTVSGGVRVSGKHSHEAVAGDIREVGVVDPCGPQVRDVAVAALVGANI